MGGKQIKYERIVDYKTIGTLDVRFNMACTRYLVYVHSRLYTCVADKNDVCVQFRDYDNHTRLKHET